MPIVVTDERAPNQLIIPGNATIFEVNPWEIGSHDPTTFAYAPLEFTGSNFSGGIIPSGELCTVGFDNIGFVVGTSSSLFNQFFLQINSTNIPQALANAISNILAQWGEQNGDISLWPNPFYGFHNDTNLNSQSEILTLVDGGEDLQNIPFYPLLRPIRQVDVIFAVESSADTLTRWPNGTSMVATYNRSRLNEFQNSTSFPDVPDQNTFINLGLNEHPTFFGCDTQNSTQTPLVVYLPNAPISYYSNVSTFDLNYPVSDRNSIILNGYNVATQANSTLDSDWPACVGCAVLFRSFLRSGTTPPATCTQCFSKYCWNGTTNSTTPATYDPTIVVKSGAVTWRHSSRMSLALVASLLCTILESVL